MKTIETITIPPCQPGVICSRALISSNRRSFVTEDEDKAITKAIPTLRELWSLVGINSWDSIQHEIEDLKTELQSKFDQVKADRLLSLADRNKAGCDALATIAESHFHSESARLLGGIAHSILERLLSCMAGLEKEISQFHAKIVKTGNGAFDDLDPDPRLVSRVQQPASHARSWQSVLKTMPGRAIVVLIQNGVIDDPAGLPAH
jgi:hypothetical protein